MIIITMKSGTKYRGTLDEWDKSTLDSYFKNEPLLSRGISMADPCGEYINIFLDGIESYKYTELKFEV